MIVVRHLLWLAAFLGIGPADAPSSAPHLSTASTPGLAAGQPASTVRKSALSVHYLGNEAVMIASGQQRILFDPFFEEDFGNYTLVPDRLLKALMAGSAPYDKVSAIFISHIHPDHFSSGRTIAYLRAHPSVHLFSTREVYDALRAAGIPSKDPLMSRLHSIYVARGAEPSRIAHEGLRIEAYPIPHGNRPLEHLAFRVTMDSGKTVMHLGDADGVDSMYAPYQADFDRTALDVLLAPDWLLLDPPRREVLERRLKARVTAGIHAQKSEAPTSAGQRIFHIPGEEIEVQ